MRHVIALLAGASIFGIAGASGVLAADLPLKARPMVVQADPWTGWYVGVHAGAAMERSCNGFTPQGDLDPVNDNFLATLDVGCSTSWGAIGGGQFGFNQQVGRFVWGLEGDISGLSTRTSRNTAGLSGGGNLFTANQTVKLNALATVGPRFGTLLNDTTLLYVTGGMAMANVSASGGETGPVGPPQFQGSGSVSPWTPGWMVGTGVEAKIGGGPWSIKGEYTYARFRSVRYDTQQPPVNIGTGFDNIGENISATTQLNIFRVGLNYKISSPSAKNDAYAMADAPVYNWTGAYFGANIGGVWGRTRAMEPLVQPPGIPFNAVGDTFTANTSGVTGGAQAGYNWQMNQFVLGVEGDLGYLGPKGQQISSAFADTFVNSTGGIYGTFRGRVGFAVDRALLYATGGLMVADVGAGVSNPINPSFNAPNNTEAIIFTNKTGAQAGWTLGGGLEYAVANGWSLKGEYLHYDLGTKQVAGNCVNCTAGPQTYLWNIKDTGDIARIGFNKKIY
jgi:outer membrane immunogenic protein